MYSIYPSILQGNGTGHLSRSCDLVERLGSGARLILPDAGRPGKFSKEQIYRVIGGRPCAERVSFHMPADPGISIIDNRETPEELFGILSRQGPVIALDEGGTARDSADYVVDTLPNLQTKRANVSSVGFLDLPEGKDTSAARKGVLISFGGEDPAGLTERLLQNIVPAIFSPEEVTVLEPGISAPPWVPRGVKLREPVPDLKKELGSYELLFTSFGLTAFEACAAGTPVILLNPAAYHRDLSILAGFPEIGVGKPDLKALKHILADRHGLAEICERVIPRQRESLGGFIRNLRFDGSRGCPVCGGRGNPAVARFEDSTYFHCPRCGIMYMENFAGSGSTYGKSYFFEEYRRQYGKTYLEDFDAIRGISVKRVEILKKIAGKTGNTPRLLDVGCAYGPFLAEAVAGGFEAGGIDVSAEAVAYVSGTLHIPAKVSSFEDFEPPNHEREKYDAITMWYVIEHFSDLDPVLRKVSRLLVPGGVFAFSTPNLRGISGRRNLQAYLESSPADHRTVFSPSSARKVLRNYGLSLARIRITGHHPERFPPGPAPLYNLISRACGLGDTFEVYAVKTGVP